MPGLCRSCVALDRTLVGEVPKHALQLSAIGVFTAEGARNLTRACLSGVILDEGKQLFAGGEGVVWFRAGQDDLSCGLCRPIRQEVGG